MTSSASTLKNVTSARRHVELWLTERQRLIRLRWSQISGSFKTKEKAVTYEVDDKGYVELGELERDWYFLEQMRIERVKLDAAISKCEQMFAAKMKEAGASGFKINGVEKVSYRKDATFPTAKFVEGNPHIAAAYTTTKEVFDLAKFKELNPGLYQEWRGHSFKYVQPKKGN